VSAPCQSNRHASKYNSKENSQVFTSWGFPSKVSGAGTCGRTAWELAIVMKIIVGDQLIIEVFPETICNGTCSLKIESLKLK